MKVKGKKKEIIISISFLVFVFAVFASAFYFNQAEKGMELVSGNAVAGINSFTDKLTLLSSLIILVIVVITVIMLINYFKRIKK